MIKIHLMGELVKVCGVSTIEAICSDLYDVIQCLRINFPQVQEYFRDHALAGQGYTVRYGDYYIDESEIDFLIGRRDVVICPVLAGSSTGIFKVIAGAVIAGVSLYFGFAPGVMAGISLALNGLLDIITPSEQGPQKKEDEEKSSLFSGSENTIKQGNIVPITWGECWAASQVVSFGIRTYLHLDDEEDED